MGALVDETSRDSLRSGVARNFKRDKMAQLGINSVRFGLDFNSYMQLGLVSASYI